MRLGMAAATLGLMWAASASAAGPTAPIYREIKDWLVACDNGRACVAKAVPDPYSPALAAPEGEDPPAEAYLRIDRAPGPTGALTLSLTAETKFDPKTLRLDGKPIPGGFAWKGPAEDGELELSGADALAFVRAIRSGSLLTVGSGARAPRVSLSGLSAVLLAIDEAQGRLGNTTAFVRTGAGAASAVPPGPSLPTLRRAPAVKPLPNPEALTAKVRKAQAAVLDDHGCDEDRHQYDTAGALNDKEAIVLLSCGYGAYQGWSVAFRVDRTTGAAKLLVLPDPPGLKSSADSQGDYMEAEFDPKTQTFTEWAKGRGLADCGASATWVYDGQAFQLAEYTRQERCGGGYQGDWPTLWRTVVKP